MYRLRDHTADIAIEAVGHDFPAAMSECARGLVEVVTGHPPTRRGREPLAFRIEAPDGPALVVAFLSELLWLLESKDLSWSSGGVQVGETDDGYWLEADANGRVIHGGGVEVKAITYHGLRIDHLDDAVRIYVIVDI